MIHFISSILLITGVLSVPVNLIIDTDASYDVDDVVAICMAHTLMDMGEVDIKAIVHNAGYPKAVGAVSVLNTYYGRQSIPIGAYKGSFGKDYNGEWVKGDYIDDLVANYPSPIKNSSQVPSAVDVYRSVLATAEDHSIVVASLGFVTNLADLLRSEADDISPYSGVQLVANKVKKVVWQGGWYEPTHEWNVSTYNFNCGTTLYGESIYDPDTCKAEAQFAINHMPHSVQMIFSDIGDDVYSGGELSFCSSAENPCRQAVIDQMGYGVPRKSWDPVVVLTAVRGARAVYSGEYGEGNGVNIISAEGSNWWDWGKDTGHPPEPRASSTSSGTSSLYIDKAQHSWLVMDGAWSQDNDAMEGLNQDLGHQIDDLLCIGPSSTH